MKGITLDLVVLVFLFTQVIFDTHILKIITIPISINFLTNTCKVISFHLQNIRPVNQDLIRKQMLFGIAPESSVHWNF